MQHIGFGPFCRRTSSGADTDIIFEILTVNPGDDLGLSVLMDQGTMKFDVDGVIVSPLTLELASGGGTFETNASTATLNTKVIGTGGLYKTGSGTLTIENANTYTGATEISNGTLALGDQGSISTSTWVTVHLGATFDVSGASSATINDLNGWGAINLGSNSLGVDGGEFSGVASGTGGIWVDTGTLVLTGENTFTGQAASGGGTLQIGNGGTTGSVAGNILNQNVLIFDRSNNVVYEGAISGNGEITFTGGGSYVLTATSSASGEITIDTGTTLQWGNGGATGWIGGSGVSVGGSNRVGRGRIVGFAVVGSIEGRDPHGGCGR